MATHYDAIIIGAGQAGPALAQRLTSEGLSTAIIEREHVGGTCVNVGCTPTKTLVASARAAYMARRASDFGVMNDGEVRVDLARVKARKDAVVRASRDSVSEWLRSMPSVSVYEGHGRFVGPDRVRVNGEVLKAERIFINTGARPAVPGLPGLDQVESLTSTGMLDLDVLPEHLVIVGGSYVGLEFAQMYRRFGSQVTVIEQGERLIRHEDPDVSWAVKAILEAEGIEVRLKSACLSVRRQDDGMAVHLACQDGPAEILGSHLLLAVGRQPNTDDLGLDTAGIATDGRGFIRVDERLRTTVPGVWALGDVNGRGAFTHTAYNDYEVVAANLLDDDPRRVSDRIPAYALYIDPPLGRAGLTERQARETGRPVLVGKRMMTRVGRARERGETQGFMKVLIDAETQRILGAAILGIGGDEVIHSLLDGMYAGTPYTVIQRAVHIHPTVSELIPTLLGDLAPLE
ncbi:MAG: FAD-containing oxidoreductase [Gammaproteobacteria bacterium]|jgi:pyruvate/2-oxoglutarate dehydrogenase complex dihydrolipoamide dehydrogenase (E3) component|nr:FAD-containing oxidoreductase [Gammaproteobacteria bacterium]